MIKQLLASEQKKQAQLKRYGYDVPGTRKFIIEKSGLVRGRLLEIGTGKGHFAIALARKGFSLVTVDLDPQPQKLAREYLRQKKLLKKVRVRVMNAETLRFGDGCFDTVISVNFMHHACRPLVCLAEMARVTKMKIVIADVNGQGAKILDRLHKQSGHSHPLTQISFAGMRTFLQSKGSRVKTYRGFCQTILVAGKGE